MTRENLVHRGKVPNKDRGESEKKTKEVIKNADNKWHVFMYCMDNIINTLLEGNALIS